MFGGFERVDKRARLFCARQENRGPPPAHLAMIARVRVFPEISLHTRPGGTADAVRPMPPGRMRSPPTRSNWWLLTPPVASPGLQPAHSVRTRVVEKHWTGGHSFRGARGDQNAARDPRRVRTRRNSPSTRPSPRTRVTRRVHAPVRAQVHACAGTSTAPLWATCAGSKERGRGALRITTRGSQTPRSSFRRSDIAGLGSERSGRNPLGPGRATSAIRRRRTRPARLDRRARAFRSRRR